MRLRFCLMPLRIPIAKLTLEVFGYTSSVFGYASKVKSSLLCGCTALDSNVLLNLSFFNLDSKENSDMKCSVVNSDFPTIDHVDYNYLCKEKENKEIRMMHKMKAEEVDALQDINYKMGYKPLPLV
ncbi:Complement Factor B [Manis pentadactyla]|nr:Complement Factor B [Manis pentadactyla]